MDGLGFNTSHVTLYLLTKCEIRTFLNKFQYISCYSLSWYKTVYYPETITFQYISCYSLSPRKNSLSMGLVVSIHLMLLFIVLHVLKCSTLFWFQYISCYSLSTEMENFMLILFSFNTSHVTLYPSFYRLFFF